VAEALDAVDLEAWVRIFKSREKDYLLALAQATLTGKL
jgi:hypothetical protein